jgi:hypothetical protein
VIFRYIREERAARARGVSHEDLKWLFSEWTTPKEVMQLAADADRVITL